MYAYLNLMKKIFKLKLKENEYYFELTKYLYVINNVNKALLVNLLPKLKKNSINNLKIYIFFLHLCL